MKKYKLYQLLKLRKKMGSDIATLNNRLRNNNQVFKGNVRDYEPGTIMGEITTLKTNLIKVKLAIQTANVGVYEKIFKMEESKDTISNLRNLPCENGLSRVASYGNSDMVEYESILTKVNIDTLVTAKELEVEALQEAIDFYNHTTEIEVDI